MMAFVAFMQHTHYIDTIADSHSRPTRQIDGLGIASHYFAAQKKRSRRRGGVLRQEATPVCLS